MERAGSVGRGRHAAPGGPSSYDAVIVDTAPTGHALKFFDAPRAASVIADRLDDLQREHRAIRQQLARVARPEAADHLIARLSWQAQEAGRLLRDPSRATLHWITLPEELSLAETGDALRMLKRTGLPVADIIVNRMIGDGGPCVICDRRREAERKVLAKACGVAGETPLRIVYEDVEEPRGIEALAQLGASFRSRVKARETASAANRTISAAARIRADRTIRATPDSAPQPHPADSLREARLVFFGGKGGVGKTTVAAAAAVRMARSRPDRSMLLLSTDPAHSLSDVLGARVTDTPACLRGGPPNLFVRELDAAAALESRRADLEHALDEIADAVGPGGSLGPGRGVRELIDLAPPGIDELFGMLSLIETGRTYATIVIDTAPTGHLLRLLELPETAREWVQALLGVLLKYRRVVRPGRLAAQLVTLSRQVRTLQAMLRDPARALFVVVVRPADLPLREGERLVARLRQLNMAVPQLVVNAVTFDPGACRRCRAVVARERRRRPDIETLGRRAGRRCAIIHTPLTQPPPRGVPALERWSCTWTS
jgi:arsenite-transporting ATPase